jgi:hypothetical protein
MMLTALLSLLLTPPPTVTIYVGPQSRDGFVDADRGVQDSIADIQAALAKSKDLRVVSDEEGASLKLYVVSRQKGAGPGSITSGVVTGGAGTAVSSPSTDYALVTLLRAGSYERQFIAEANSHREWRGNWKGCARKIAKDLSAWVAANRERLSGPN